MNKITIAGLQVTEDLYPNLYPMAMGDPERLKLWLEDLKERSGSKSIEMTATMLEMDLEHERLCNG